MAVYSIRLVMKLLIRVQIIIKFTHTYYLTILKDIIIIVKPDRQTHPM